MKHYRKSRSNEKRKNISNVLSFRWKETNFRLAAHMLVCLTLKNARAANKMRVYEIFVIPPKNKESTCAPSMKIAAKARDMGEREGNNKKRHTNWLHTLSRIPIVRFLCINRWWCERLKAKQNAQRLNKSEEKKKPNNKSYCHLLCMWSRTHLLLMMGIPTVVILVVWCRASVKDSHFQHKICQTLNQHISTLIFTYFKSMWPNRACMMPFCNAILLYIVHWTLNMYTYI